MAIVAPLDYVQVGGKVDVLCAFSHFTYVGPVAQNIIARRNPSGISDGPSSYVCLWKLGELEDEVDPRYRNIMGRVSGDRMGGSAGDAMEMQYLGRNAEIDLVLSRWDQDVFSLMQLNGGINYDSTGTNNVTNAIRLTDFGGLMMRDRSFRLLLRPNRSDGAYFIQNFPCCLLESDFGANVGTKYSRLSLRVSAHRTPEGHWSDPTGTAGSSGNGNGTIGVLMNGNSIGV